MTYQGIYINLDRSTDRRAEMETELARVGLGTRYKRLSAVDGKTSHFQSPLTNPSEVGCFLSHVAALKEGLKNPQHLHIVEDDTVFARCTDAAIDWAIKCGHLDQFDILYADIALPLSNESFRTFKKLYDQTVTRDAHGAIAQAAFQIIDLKDQDYTAASSYIINAQSLKKLEQLYHAEIAKGIRVPVDDFLKLQAKVGAIKAGCLFPFVTSIRVEHTLDSTIRIRPDTSRKFTAANIGRYSFYVDCDWNECQRLMDAHIKMPAEDDRHTQLLARLLAYSLTLDDKKTTP